MSAPDTLRPSTAALFAEGLEAVADALDNIENMLENAHREHLIEVSKIFKEQENNYDRYVTIMKALDTLNHGIGEIHRLFEVHDEDDKQFQEDTRKRLTKLESKVPPNGAAHQ